MLLDENPLIELTDADATNLTSLLFASVRKAVGERIVPASDNRKQYFNKVQKNYPLLLRKFMADKAKISSLVEIILYMNLEFYSLKRQEQAIVLCSTESQGELQDFSRNKLKELEDELLDKLKSATKEVIDGEDEYSLLVNLKRLYELQLLRPVSIEEFYGDCITILHSFRNLDNEVVSFLLLNMSIDVAWSFHSIVNSETVVSEGALFSLLSRRGTLLGELEYFLNTPPEIREGSNSGNQQACWVKPIGASNSYLLSAYHLLHSLDMRQKMKMLIKSILRSEIRDKVMLAAAKLIDSDTVPKDYLAPEIISHFVMHGAGIAEIVKNLITVLKKKDYNVSVIFLEALKREWHVDYRRVGAYSLAILKLKCDGNVVIFLPVCASLLMVHVFFSPGLQSTLSESDDESLKSKTFQEYKNLASWLAGIFIGAAWNKHRPPSFLEASVLHFASRLPPPDIRDIPKDIERRTENVNTEEDPSGWRPYNIFYDSLQEKCAKNDGIQDEKEHTTARRRGRPRKRRNIEGRRLFDDHNSSEEEDSINTSNQEDAQVEEDEEEDNAPLIHSLKSAAKLRSLRVSRQ
ncbi:NPL4-like protein 1 [Hibiscus syriacus]|uniref:NPL4-like protein 1 n=1 Tax=Hibiscus syriacus TaxID=106335 RepID=A0A6A2ZK55_HIBSY|nr:NPL4-like protein 1 [Hibiscus syriacus]